MFRFENQALLYALLIIPVLAVFFYMTWHYRKKALQRFGNVALVKRLMPQASNVNHILKFVILAFALTFLVVGWANPQWATKKKDFKRKGVDVIIALDVSQSIMAEDISPSRLERAKRFAQDLIKKLQGDRVGFVIFAGNAFLQVPVTTDYGFIMSAIRSAHPNMVPNQGTAIGDVIEVAEQSFDPNNKQHKVLVVITDGENHDDEALAQAQEASDNGLIIMTVGVGTPEGAFIPVYVGGQLDYKRDDADKPVRSKLDESILEALAGAGNGRYFNLLAGIDVIGEALREQIDLVEKQEYEQRVFTDFESYFQYFVAIGVLLLMIEFFLPYRKSKRSIVGNLFGKEEHI